MLSAAHAGRLDIERFSAATFVLDVWVAEAEALVQAFLAKIQLRAVEVDQAFLIDDDRDILGFKHLVVGRYLIGKLERVRKPGASCRAHTKTQTDPLAALVEVLLDVRGSGVCQRDTHAHITAVT